MSTFVEKVMVKHNLRPIKGGCSKRKAKGRIVDIKIQENLLKARSQYIESFIEDKLQDKVYLRNLLSKVAKSEVSRKYNQITELYAQGYDVVWGLGGHQLKRIAELDQKQKKFIWIENVDE